MNADPGNHTRSGKYTLEAGAEGPLVPTNYAIAINGEAIGSIGLDFGADIYYRTAELGYWFVRIHASSLIFQMLTFALHVVGLVRSFGAKESCPLLRPPSFVGPGRLLAF